MRPRWRREPHGPGVVDEPESTWAAAQGVLGTGGGVVMVQTLSVRQPYAGQIAIGAKLTEYRSWPTMYRGRLLVVAAKTRDEPIKDDTPSRCVPIGCTVCTVDLYDIHWSAEQGEYLWCLRQPILVPNVAHKGKLRLYQTEVPQEWKNFF